MTEDELRNEFIASLPRLAAFRSRLTAELDRALDSKTIEVRSRIKSWDAIRQKLERRQISRISDISDLIGIRVVVPDAATLDYVTNAVTGTFFVTSRETLHLRDDESSAYLIVRGGSSLSSDVVAEVQILTAAEEARRELEHDLRFHHVARPTAVPDFRDATKRLTQILHEFGSLIDRPGTHEKQDVHPYLKINAFLLYPGQDAVISEVPIGLGTEYRIDFLIQRPDGTYVLVEIENPQAAVVTQSGDFSATVNHALCQVEDWQEWIEGNLPTVERYYPGMRAFEAWVVVGRRRGLTEVGLRRIARRNVNMRGRVGIKTYDDLMRDAEAYVRSITHALRQPGT